MNNYLISFNKEGNPIVWLPTIVPKGQLETYLKFLNKKESENTKCKN